MKDEIKKIIKEIRGVKRWKIAIKELQKQGKYIKEELKGVKKEIREGRLNGIKKRKRWQEG